MAVNARGKAGILRKNQAFFSQSAPPFFRSQKNIKKFKKPIDKSKCMWYNIKRAEGNTNLRENTKWPGSSVG
jgi:hypothetical protein